MAENELHAIDHRFIRLLSIVGERHRLILVNIFTAPIRYRHRHRRLIYA